MSDKQRITVTVNDQEHDLLVEPRTLALDLLRDELRLTGTHAGCEQGVCGACTILVDGKITRACLMFAVQLDGCSVETVESLGSPDGTMHPIQRAFSENHGLQCGFCTPGMLMVTQELLRREPRPDAETARAAIAGNHCRCTGYQHIVASVCAAGRAMSEAEHQHVDRQDVEHQGARA
ncbi:(2Fe-2S)-binding protein [Actinomycetospora sp. NBRC 106378]|uniref:(2Fe-2S)-binding protein n=1 Tax=Actinomycetospora sp. NBRC 106378 TaxID=3032208 RepID=UPI00249FE2DB|nr:(2Fe-2S)-binding protein [Actinomycetospora sp. NBRC 106378]GLZ53513.1 (2Fe-2S)-binding protein [Actinomycetospora sp. NBRC 106378]